MDMQKISDSTCDLLDVFYNNNNKTFYLVIVQEHDFIPKTLCLKRMHWNGRITIRKPEELQDEQWDRIGNLDDPKVRELVWGKGVKE